MKILAVYNIKGGVGKTAAAVNLACLAAGSGQRVLLWDLDPQGAASFYFRVKPKVKGGISRLLRGGSGIAKRVKETDYPGLDLLPADFSYRHFDVMIDKKKPHRALKQALATFRKSYDLIVIDCPPSISRLSEGLFLFADALIVPTIPTTLSMRTLEQLTNFHKDNDLSAKRIWPFLSMVDKRRVLHKQLGHDLSRSYKRCFETAIPYTADVEMMGIKRRPVVDFAPRSGAAKAYADLWDEVSDRLRKL